MVCRALPAFPIELTGPLGYAKRIEYIYMHTRASLDEVKDVLFVKVVEVGEILIRSMA